MHFCGYRQSWGIRHSKRGFEEGLQEVMEPIFSALVFEKDYEPAKLEDVAYSFLLGALSAGFFEGGSVVSGDINTIRQGMQFHELGNDVVEAMINEGLQSAKDTASYRVAFALKAKLDAGQRISDYELGRLYGENVKAIEQENEIYDIGVEDNLTKI